MLLKTRQVWEILLSVVENRPEKCSGNTLKQEKKFIMSYLIKGSLLNGLYSVSQFCIKIYSHKLKMRGNMPKFLGTVISGQ
jgi:hypothetical protein